MSDTEQSEGEASSDWKRDSIWHYRNWILAFIGIIITVAIFLYEDSRKPVKALTCDLVAVSPLVSVEDDVNRRVQVVFDGKPVANAKFALIKVTNAGNVPIEESDFKRPLTLHFGGSGTNSILTAQLLNSHPGYLGATVDYKANSDTLTLEPLLLNPDDNITLKVIYTGAGQNVNVDARIVGVPEVTRTNPAKAEEKVSMRLFYVLDIMTPSLLLIGIFLLFYNKREMRRIIEARKKLYKMEEERNTRY